MCCTSRYMHVFTKGLFFGGRGEPKLFTLRPSDHRMRVPNEPGLSRNNDLENAFLSERSMAIPARGKHSVVAPKRPAMMARAVMSSHKHFAKVGTSLRLAQLDVQEASIHRSMQHTTEIRINAGQSLPSPTTCVAGTLGPR